MPSPDVLLFFSDQHSPVFTEWDEPVVRTPHMREMRDNGTSFSAAYTSCPLCVPARVSMLTGRLPSNTGVLSNQGAIPETTATFLHSMVAAGYETVLIGRMHFIGTNQRHGFIKRFVGDITPVTWVRPVERLKAERGVLAWCYSEPHCLDVIGGGDSQVLEYDKAVVTEALEYLSKPHEKPQCIVVGTYGPHFPYVAPPELYAYYKERITLPDSFNNLPKYLNPVLQAKTHEISDETAVAARAAYFGMIETIDGQLGEVRAAFKEYLHKNAREGVFVYSSDHGDQCGERRMYGKKTFFEQSSRIPLILEGAGISPGQIINTPASIVDIGPTLCAIAGATPPSAQDGVNLLSLMHGDKSDMERPVVSEFIERHDGRHVAARMIRCDNFKLITYTGYEEYDLLFNLSDDPAESRNLAEDEPELLRRMRSLASNGWNPAEITSRHSDYLRNIELVTEWEKAINPDDSERWNKNPEYAKVMPAVR